MLYTAKTLKGYEFYGHDGLIGKVEELFFDDQHWAVRYLVADTGEWLTGRQVLISPYALLEVDRKKRKIFVDLTRKQIEESPFLELNQPVLQQFEDAYYGYFGWPRYWNGPYMWGKYATVLRDRTLWDKFSMDEKPWDSKLHSTEEVTGLHIQASDGGIGHVEDFIIDDESWAIRYMIVDTSNWWAGKKVLISPQWIERISWEETKVFVDLQRDNVQDSPLYTTEDAISREFEAGLHHHYKRQVYWDMDQKPANPHKKQL